MRYAKALQALRRISSSLVGVDTLILVDQVISGLTNFLVLGVSLRLLSVEEIGRVSLAYTLMASAVAITRSSLGQLLLIFGAPQDAQRGARLGAIGIGAAVSIVCVPFLYVADFEQAAAVIALTLPALLVADVQRHIAIKQGQALRVLAYDALWLIIECGGLALAMVTGHVQGIHILLVYLLAGLAACPVLMLRTHQATEESTPSNVFGSMYAARRDATAWIRKNLKALGTFGFDTVWQSVWANISGLLVMNFAGLATLGAYRASQATFLPISSAMGALAVLVARDVSSKHRHAILFLPRTIIATACGVAIITVTMNPLHIGTALFGDVAMKNGWGTAAFFVSGMVGCVTMTALPSLRWRGDLKFLAMFRAGAAPSETALVTMLAMSGGPVGAALASLAASIWNGVAPEIRLRYMEMHPRVDRETVDVMAQA